MFRQMVLFRSGFSKIVQGLYIYIYMGIYVGLQDEEATAGNGKSALSVVSYVIYTDPILIQ